MSDWFIFSEYLPIDVLISLWSRDFTIFQISIPKWLQSDSKAVNTCKDKKRRKIVHVLKEYLDKFDIKPSRLVLSVTVWCEKEAYSATGMENNLHLFVKPYSWNMVEIK